MYQQRFSGPIRPADLDRSDDTQAIVTVLNAYAEDTMGAGEPLSQEVQDRLVPALRRVPDHLVLLACDGEAAVGLAICFQGFSTFRARPLLNIHDLAVVSSHRGRGIATALLAAIEAEARRRDCCKLTLEVREDNPRAEALYRALGFGAGSAGEFSVQYRFMEKRLGPSA